MATVATAIGVDAKQLANILSRVDLHVDRSGRQGRARRLSTEVVAVLDLVTSLGAIGLPAASALRLAQQLVESGTTDLAPSLVVAYDAEAHRRDLDGRLRAAAERVIRRPRGRPPGRGRPME